MVAKNIAEKLLIKPETTVWLSDNSYVPLIEPLPSAARLVNEPEKAATAVVFAESAKAVREILNRYGDRLAQPGTFWIAYPKANRADINRDTLWPIVAEHGMRPISQVAVDEVWSALRFRPLREGETPFTGGRLMTKRAGRGQ